MTRIAGEILEPLLEVLHRAQDAHENADGDERADWLEIVDGAHTLLGKVEILERLSTIETPGGEPTRTLRRRRLTVQQIQESTGYVPDGAPQRPEVVERYVHQLEVHHGDPDVRDDEARFHVERGGRPRPQPN